MALGREIDNNIEFLFREESVNELSVRNTAPDESEILMNQGAGEIFQIAGVCKRVEADIFIFRMNGKHIIDKAGADELVLLDITASSDARNIIVDIVRAVADCVFIPFTVGGGIRTVEDFTAILRAGADKVSVNSAAVHHPEIINEAAYKFGSQCVVTAIDAKRRDNGQGWDVFINGGRINTGKDVLQWAMEAEKRGAGEILLTSMDCDGVKNGYDLALTRAVSENVGIPVIASGGAGQLEHFYDAFTEGKADAVLAASLFHFGEISIMELKQYLNDKSIPVRMV